MSRSRILPCFDLLVVAGALLLAQVAHAQFQIAPLQQLPMSPPAVRPTKLAHFGEFAFTDGQTILVTVDEGNVAYT